MAVTLHQVRDAVQKLGLTGQALCVHASLRSFGWVDGGPSAIVNGLLAEGCTLIVPTFSLLTDCLGWAEARPHIYPTEKAARVD